MAFSFSRLVIPESDSIMYEEAFKLVAEKHLQMERQGTASCIGEIDGYKIRLGFWRGVPAWDCSCNKGTDLKIQKMCIHAIALSLLWDRSRGIPNPSQEDVLYLTQKS